MSSIQFICIKMHNINENFKKDKILRLNILYRNAIIEKYEGGIGYKRTRESGLYEVRRCLSSRRRTMTMFSLNCILVTKV